MKQVAEPGKESLRFVCECRLYVRAKGYGRWIEVPSLLWNGTTEDHFRCQQREQHALPSTISTARFPHPLSCRYCTKVMERP